MGQSNHRCSAKKGQRAILHVSIDSVAQGNAWQQITPSGSPPAGRSRHTATWSTAADGLYIFGGLGSSGAPG